MALVGCDFSPISNGMSLSHRQSFGNVDVVAGGNVFSDKTYLSVGHEQRLRADAKMRYRPSLNWQMGGALQGQYQQMGRFILWDDFVTNAYLPMEGTSSEDRWFNWHADGWAKGMTPGGGTHHFNTRVYQTTRYGSGPEPTMASTLGMGQYRYSKAFGRHLTLQAGGFLSFQKSYSSLYPGIQLLTFNVARFEQIEWAKNGWKLGGGVRYESNLNPGVYDEDSGPVFRFGVNRTLTPSTHVRLSYGESLRFASIAEKYVVGSLSDGINIRGNLGLKASQATTGNAGWCKNGMGPLEALSLKRRHFFSTMMT